MTIPFGKYLPADLRTQHRDDDPNHVIVVLHPEKSDKVLGEIKFARREL